MTTVRPPTTHRSSTSPSTNKPTLKTQRPSNKTSNGSVQSTTATHFSSTTVRPSTAAKKPATKSALFLRPLVFLQFALLPPPFVNKLNDNQLRPENQALRCHPRPKVRFLMYPTAIQRRPQTGYGQL
jgi:hypothetical protein